MSSFTPSNNNRSVKGGGNNRTGMAGGGGGEGSGRKTRIKTNVAMSEFIGFSAFANDDATTPSFAAFATTTPATPTTATSPDKKSHKPGPLFAPVFAGSDNHLAMLFRKIGQKRDAVTKSKALADLTAFAFAPKGNDDDCGGGGCGVPKTTDAAAPLPPPPCRKDQVAALSHLLFLYTFKLYYDNSSVVRAQCLLAIHAAQWHVPKAWKTALLGGDGGDLLGKIWSTQFDPAAEVVRAASPLIAALETVSEQAHQAIVAGTCRLASLVLTFGRAQALHEELLSSSASSSSASEPARGGKSQQTPEKEQDGVPADEKEERYERVLLGTMTAMTRLLEQYPNDPDKDICYTNHIFDSILWKHLHSQRSAFRRRTYALLSAISLRAPSLLHSTIPHKLSTALPSSLSSEKDPANIPALLEALLLYITSFSKTDPPKNAWEDKNNSGGDDDQAANGINVESMVKALGKLLKRAGHGSSPASEWCPIFLPLLATLPADAIQLHVALLESLWEGRTATTVPNDQMEIVHATAESAAFLLQRQKHVFFKTTENREKDTEEEEKEETDMQAIVPYFVNPLIDALHETRSKITPNDAKLLSSMANHLFKLGHRKQGDSDSVMNHLWQGINKALCPSPENGDKPVFFARLATIVNLLGERLDKTQNEDEQDSNDEKITHHLVAPALRLSFVSTLRHSKMGKEQLELLLAIITLFGAHDLFASLQEHGLLQEGEEDWGSLPAFCKNTVVWITAPLEETLHAENRYEFAILLHCLALVESPEERNAIWECVVGKLLEAPHFKVFARGLSSMAMESKKLMRKRMDNLDVYSTLRSESLEGFIEDKGVEYEQDNDWKGDDVGLSLLIRTSLGLTSESGRRIVGAKVVSRWIEAACRDDDVAVTTWTTKNREVVVLAIVSALVSDTDLIMSRQEIVKLVVECWLRGGTMWEEASRFWVSKLLAEQETCNLVVQAASAKLQSYVAAPPVSGDDFSTERWSDAALRLMRLCFGHSIVEPPYLRLTGLDQLDLWEAHATTTNTAQGSSFHLWICTMSLLQKCQEAEERTFLFGSHSSAELVVRMLIVFADAVSLTHSTHLAVRRCLEFQRLLHPNTHVAEYLEETTRILARAMKQQGDESILPTVYRGVAVLDMLSGDLVGRFTLNASLSFVPADAKKGDVVLYTKEGESAQEATIVGIHTDDFPNLYFTIRVETFKGEWVERQTVASRLQKKKSKETPAESAKEAATRRRIEALLVKDLVQPFLVDVSPKPEPKENPFVEAACRCLSIVISRFGLTGPVGIGSVRYDVFQLVTTLEKALCTSIQKKATRAEIAFLFRCMALLLGVDALLSNVGVSSSNAAILRFSPSDSVAAVVAAHEKGNLLGGTKGRIEQSFCRSILMWIAVSVESSPEGSGNKLMRVVDGVSAKMKDATTTGTEGADDVSIVLLVAFLETLKVVATAGQEWHAQVGNAVSNVMARVMDSFVSSWDSFAETTPHDNQLDGYWQAPLWLEPMLALIRLVGHQSTDNALLASVPYSDELLAILSSPSKRWCAYLVLLRKLQEQGSAEGSDLPQSTKSRLETWKQSLDQEETKELEDDVRAVSTLLPHCLMERLERWSEEHEGDFDIEDEDEVMGRLLVWLLFLEFWDSASDADVRNRSALSCYIRKTQACGEIFDICIVYCTDGSLRSNDWQECMKAKESGDVIDPSSLDLSQLAALALFRTVELLPTLTRSWWTDDCPRGTQAAVTEFIRKHVAPETLRRDLSRIKNASDSLGDMSVSGSLVSREVVATYEQDECQLSVTIRLPPMFPLKNVEVDCTNTLGIAERRWKRWSLLIMRMLNGQDGTILDALQLWKANVDREFEGVEPCPVCYSVLDVKTRSLPNLECKTCGNRFHSACLYKWFQSSGKSQCVLCQQPWSGNKIS